MSDIFALIVYVVSGIAYFAVVAVAFVKNWRRDGARVVALLAVMAWPLCGIGASMLTIFTVPMLALFATHGSDFSQPISDRHSAIALGALMAYLVVIAGLALWVDS